MASCDLPEVSRFLRHFSKQEAKAAGRLVCL